MAPDLLSLPPEIRLMIWEYALPSNDEPRVVHHPPPFKFCYERTGDPWALYRTCRTIRNELPPIESKGITLVLHMFPWQSPGKLSSGPRDSVDGNGPESLWAKFLRMAPFVERLRLSGPRLCMPGQYHQHRDELHRLIKRAPMPRLTSVEVQPQAWRMDDWGLAFQLVGKLGLGKQDVAFLNRDGNKKFPPSDLHQIPEWHRLKGARRLEVF